jgi:hypothetical protein
MTVKSQKGKVLVVHLQSKVMLNPFWNRYKDITFDYYAIGMRAPIHSEVSKKQFRMNWATLI